MLRLSVSVRGLLIIEDLNCSFGFFFVFFSLGHVGNCKSCEDGTLGICTQSAASPLPFSGVGIFVLFCVEATFTPVGGLQ